MMKDLLEEIRNAEKEAEDIQAKAIEEAKQMVLNADEESRKIRNDTIKAVKYERLKVIESANKEGQAQAAKIISSGKVSSAKMIKEMELTKSVDFVMAIVFIKDKVFERYGNC